MNWWIAGAALLWVVGAVATYGHAYSVDAGMRFEIWLIKSDSFVVRVVKLGIICAAFLIAWPYLEWEMWQEDPGE